jgi:hypothetical protein
MTVGMYLLSRLEVATTTAVASAYLLVLGLGLGLVMQVLVLAVQNSVSYAVLGTATAGVTMLRGIGGSVGTAVFGSIFTNRLVDIRANLPAPVQDVLAGGGRLTGEQVEALPAAARAAYQQGYVDALTPVFLVAAGVTLAGFAVSWLLREEPLRATAATSQGLEDSLAAPRGPDSLAELERALACATTREERERFHRRVAERAGVEVSPGAVWALVRIDEHGFAGARAMAEAQDVPPDRIAEVVRELRTRELVAGDEGAPELTPTGRALTDQLVAARRDLLAEAVADESADRRPEVDALLRRLARELVGERP